MLARCSAARQRQRQQQHLRQRPRKRFMSILLYSLACLTRAVQRRRIKGNKRAVGLAKDACTLRAETDFISETNAIYETEVFTVYVRLHQNGIARQSEGVISNERAERSGHELLCHETAVLHYGYERRESGTGRNIGMIQYRAYIQTSYVVVYIVIQSGSKANRFLTV